MSFHFGSGETRFAPEREKLKPRWERGAAAPRPAQSPPDVPTLSEVGAADVEESGVRAAGASGDGERSCSGGSHG